MKKFLFLVAVALFSFGANAQNLLWKSTIADVSGNDVVNLNSPVAMDKDGNLYVTGTQRDAFDFAGNEVAVLGVGAYIAKYNAEGTELFAIALHGGIDITAIATDADNNLYVAGSYSDQAYITDVEGVAGEYQVIGTEKEEGAFLAKYDSNGNLLAVKSYQAILPLEEYFDEMWQEWLSGINGMPYYGSDPTVSISKIVADGSKVYAQFNYTGDVVVGDGLTLKAKYLFVWGMAYNEASNIAIVSFDTTLASSANVAVMTVADSAADASGIDAFNFVVDGENVYVAAFATGNIVLTTSAGDQAFDFATSDDNSGNIEEGAVVANLGKKAVKFSNELYPGYGYYNTIQGMDVVNGNLCLVGTFEGKCAFDNSKAAIGASDVFVASVKAETLEANFVSTNANDEGAVNQYYEETVGAIFNNESVSVISKVVDMNGESEDAYSNYNVSYDGTFSSIVNPMPATAVAYNDNAMAVVYCYGATRVRVYANSAFTAIENVVAEVENSAIYDLTGRRVNEMTTPGIYIVNGRKMFVK